MFIAQHLFGSGVKFKLNPLLFGVDVLFARSRHIVGVTAIEAFHFRSLFPQSGTNTVHRGIPSADDDDPLAFDLDRFIDGLAKKTFLDVDQILHRQITPFGILSIDPGAPPFGGAGPEEDRIVIFDQFLEGDIFADLRIEMEDGSRLLQLGDTALDDVFVEFEAGDAVGQQSAGTALPVENFHVDSLPQEESRDGEARGTGSDDGNLFADLFVGETGTQTFFESLFADESFDGADGDGAVAVVEGTGALTEAVVGADPSHHFGEGRGFVGESESQLQILLRRAFEPVGDEVVQGAAVVAVGVTALDAAVGLFARLVTAEDLVNLVEILDPYDHVAFDGVDPFQVKKS